MAVVCPYCLCDLTTNELQRHCNLCDATMKANFMSGLQLKRGVVPKCTSTSGCLGQYAVLKCAKCGAELPPDIAQYGKYVRFSVVAPSGAGKTNFITTMMEEMRKCRSLNFNVSYMNNETREYHVGNYRQIYEHLQPVEATRRGDVYPMQWRIQDMNKMTKNTVPCYSMTVFDGAGEDQERTDPTICRYIAGSKMIMLLLDPTQLAGVREQMTADEIEKAGGKSGFVSHEDTEGFINGLINYLKVTCSVHVGKKIQTPVAVVFGKIDSVQRHLGSAQILQSSSHAARGAFIQSEADAIHNEIDGWMDICGDNLTRMFDANFTTWRYFGVSSFGSLPTTRNQLQKPMPLRVLDPMLWNLSLEGIVPTIK